MGLVGLYQWLAKVSKELEAERLSQWLAKSLKWFLNLSIDSTNWLAKSLKGVWGKMISAWKKSGCLSDLKFYLELRIVEWGNFFIMVVLGGGWLLDARCRQGCVQLGWSIMHSNMCICFSMSVKEFVFVVWPLLVLCELCLFCNIKCLMTPTGPLLTSTDQHSSPV